jgi:phosphomannomutase
MRASNTQAVVVVRAEAGSPEGLDRVKRELAAELAPSGLSLP